jgi:NADH:ubiquinone oxidoreductase subunit K
MLPYLELFSALLFAIGLAGLASERHFLLMVLSIEVSLIAATTFVISFYAQGYSGFGIAFVFAVWSIAAVEAIALIAFYRQLVQSGAGLDVRKLSRLRD